MARLSIVSTLNLVFKGYRRHLVFLFALGVLSALLDAISINALVPLLSFLLGSSTPPTDFITTTMNSVFSFFGIPFQFRYLVAFVGATFLLRAVLLSLFTYIRARVNASYLARETGSLFRETLRAEWPFVLKQKVSDLQNSIFWDTKRSGQLFDAVVQFVQSSTGALIYLFVALNISPAVTGITLVAGVIIAFVLRPLITKSRAYAAETSEMERALSHHIGEHLQGFKVVKAAGVGPAVSLAAEPYIRRLRDAFTKMIVVKSLSSTFIQPLSFVFIIGLFYVSYTQPGFNLAAFAATLYLIQKIFVYLESTQTTLHSFVQYIPYAENIVRYRNELQQHDEHDAAANARFNFERAIRYEGVSFNYPDRPATLSDISCSIEKGSMVAVIGPSGGGKTTFADLLLRLFKPSSGDILVDGTSIGSISGAEWRSHIAYVSQDAFLMHASVRDNIRFYDEHVSDEDIKEAARSAHILDDIQRLPHGFDTVIGDRGVTLSGGQRQRISLARALLRKPQLLILDEVTSALDSELEREIQKVIDELRGSLTLVVIAHRISTVTSADKIIALDSGTVVETGTPTELLADPTSYLSRMRALQSGA